MESSKGHGMENIIKAEYIGLRIFWIIFWLIGLGITLYLIASLVITYFAYGIISQSTIVNERPMLFPKVTVCNSDAFVTNASITFLAGVIRNTTQYSQKIINSGASTDLDLVNYFILNVGNFQSISLFQAQQANLSTQISLGQDVNEFIQSCSFNDVNCSPSEFIHTYNLNLGNCYTFNYNMSSIKESYSAGNFKL